jgi:hypothetical protein
MRATQDRYDRERARIDLALRFIRHEARTRTIRHWTGLTDDRIRKLYRSYVRSEPASGVRRRRGRSPQQVGFFVRSRLAQQETAALASMLSMCGLVVAGPSETGAVEVAPAAVRDGGRTLPSLQRGERLCIAFDTYRRTAGQPLISFEHAVFLATTLAAGQELCALRCAACGSLGVVDPVALRAQPCLDCGEVLAAGWRERLRPVPPRVPIHRVPPSRAGRLAQDLQR